MSMRHLLENIEHRIDEEMYALGSGGLRKLEKTGITMQANTMYAFGSSSSPEVIIVTDVDDKWIHYRKYPYQDALKINRTIGEDLIVSGIKAWLKSGYAKYQPDLAKSFKSMLEGGRGKTINIKDYEQVTLVLKNSDGKSGDLWRAAEEYGNVSGVTKDDVFYYIVTMFRGDASEAKKDKRFEVVLEKDGWNTAGIEKGIK